MLCEDLPKLSIYRAANVINQFLPRNAVLGHCSDTSQVFLSLFLIPCLGFNRGNQPQRFFFELFLSNTWYFSKFVIYSMSDNLWQIGLLHRLLNDIHRPIIMRLNKILIDFLVTHIRNVKKTIFLNFFQLLFLNRYLSRFLYSLHQGWNINSLLIEPSLRILLLLLWTSAFCDLKF